MLCPYRSYDPDLVVSVHPLMQHINCDVLRERAKRQGRARPTPFATVVTDFTTCHNAWFCKVCFCARNRHTCSVKCHFL
jgi:1,2-diacylglycerol 3-beta-galactosyltransferase